MHELSWLLTVLLLCFLCLSPIVARPPLTKEELESLPLEPEVEYFDEFLPWFYNSTKFKENLMYEKKKYLSMLGHQKKHKKI